jgi:hypothetical protein
MSTPGYKPAKMLWMDVTGCYNANAAAKEGAYELRSPGWKSTISGVLLSTLGHTHDGGVYTNLYINDRPVCTSHQLYGTKPGFFEKGDIKNVNSEQQQQQAVEAGHGGHDDKKMTMAMATTTTTAVREKDAPELWHLSEVGSCLDFGVLRAGDNVVVGAFYNNTMHKQNLAAGHGHGGGGGLFSAPPTKYA